MSEPLVPPEPPASRSWLPPDKAPRGPVPAGLTSHRSATSADHRKGLFAAVGLLIALGAAVSFYKYSRNLELQREFDAQLRDSAPVRMPAAAEPPKEMAGILPDAVERQAGIQPPQRVTDGPVPVVQAPPSSDAMLPKDLALLSSSPKHDPQLKVFEDLLAQDPAMRSAVRRFQKDRDMSVLMKAMQDDPGFSLKLAQAISDPKVQESVARLRSMKDPSHVPPVAPAEEAGPVMDPSALQEGARPEEGATVDPADVSGSGPEVSPASAPPVPRGSGRP